MAPTPQGHSAATDIAQRLARVPKGTPRHSALAAAHTFKASWVALGQALAEVHHTQAYKAWGYPQFAAYCRQELHIREETARKLVRSYGYLAEHSPASLRPDADASAAVPALDVVDLLRQARSRTQVDAAAWQAVQREALAPAEGPVSRQQVLGKLRAAFPEAYAAPAAASAPADAPRPLPAPAPSSPVDPGHARKVLLLAERLHALLAEQPALAGDAERAAVLALATSLRRHAAVPKAARRTSAAAGAPAAGVVELYSERGLH